MRCKSGDEIGEELREAEQERDAARAEVERLKQQREFDKVGLQEALFARREVWAENLRLRVALALYAHRGSWASTISYGVEYIEFTGGANVSEPWLPAQEALAGMAAETCQPPPPRELAGHAESRTDEFAGGGGDSYQGGEEGRAKTP